jgi:hypothetical protein
MFPDPTAASGLRKSGSQTDGTSIIAFTPLENAQVNHFDEQGVHAGGFFSNSHHLVLNNPIMYDIKSTTEPGALILILTVATNQN